MPTPELQLVSRVVRGGRDAYTEVVRWGIMADDFLTREGQAFWTWITTYSHGGDIPGVSMFSDVWPEFVYCDDASVSTALLCKNVRTKRLITRVKEEATKAIDNADISPLEAATVMHSAMAQIIEMGSNRNTDVPFSSALNSILSDYKRAKSGECTARASWPWPSFQDATGGIQEDDYIVFYGRPKSMKTWVLCYFIADLFWQKKKVLIYTKEMTPDNIYKRIAACLAMIPYQELRRGSLDRSQEHQLEDLHLEVDALRGHDSLVCLSGRDVANGGDTVPWFRSKAEMYKPHVGAIDGLYLMSDGTSGRGSDWNRVMNISRGISAMRLDLRLPILATMQANRKAAGHSNAELDEIAYSDAIGQDATVACRVINEKGRPTIALIVGGSREFDLEGLRIGGVPATDFKEKELLTAKEINKAKDNDTGDVETDAAHVKPIRSPRTSKQVDEEKLMDSQLKGV